MTTLRLFQEAPEVNIKCSFDEATTKHFLPGTARQRADDDEDCRDDGFERQTRQECQIVSYPDCHIEDKVKYRTEIVPQCKTRLVSSN